MASYYTNDYKNTAELLGLDSKDSVKKIQQQLLDAGYNIGTTGVDGVWGPSTDAAYWQYATPSASTPSSMAPSLDASGSSGSSGNVSGLLGLLTGSANSNSAENKKNDAVVEMDEGIKKYFDQVLANYNLPSRTPEEIQAQIEAILNPSYQAAIKERQEATAANRAMIDLDAYSRGMGASTWDTDAKMRESQKEASDLATIAGNYQAALAQSILDQMNQDQANRLTATNNAYSLALQLYQMAEAAKEKADTGILGGLGSGASEYSTYDLLTSGTGSSGSSSGSSSSSSSGSSSLKSAYDTAAKEASSVSALKNSTGQSKYNHKSTKYGNTYDEKY